MTVCYFCKKELPRGENHCVHCDHDTNTINPYGNTSAFKERSNAWYLLPILIGIIGGIIAFAVMRNDDPKKAKYCLIIGVVITVIGIIFNLVLLGQEGTL